MIGKLYVMHMSSPEKMTRKAICHVLSCICHGLSRNDKKIECQAIVGDDAVE